MVLTKTRIEKIHCLDLENMTAQELNVVKIALSRDIDKVRLDLSDKDRRDKFGRRLSREDYNNWRKSAIFAMNKMMEEYRVIRDTIERKEYTEFDSMLLEMTNLAYWVISQGVKPTHTQ